VAPRVQKFDKRSDSLATEASDAESVNDLLRGALVNILKQYLTASKINGEGMNSNRIMEVSDEVGFGVLAVVFMKCAVSWDFMQCATHQFSKLTSC
jgi:translation initiation factor IF-2